MPTSQSIKMATQVVQAGDSTDEMIARVADLLDQLRELPVMQLAAISTASVQNTPGSARDRLGPESPYYTSAYADVCRAIDREMLLRQQVSKERKRVEELMRERAAIK
jgi:hypothetical protein